MRIVVIPGLISVSNDAACTVFHVLLHVCELL